MTVIDIIDLGDSTVKVTAHQGFIKGVEVIDACSVTFDRGEGYECFDFTLAIHKDSVLVESFGSFSDVSHQTVGLKVAFKRVKEALKQLELEVTKELY